MKAAVALLPLLETQNVLRRWCIEVSRQNPGALRWTQLPPHISLKQPFAIEEIAMVDAYFSDFAARTSPVTATLAEPETEGLVAWLPVQENPELRTLHDRLNSELKTVVEDPTSDFDGDSYRFHLTIGFRREELTEVTFPARPPEIEQPILLDSLAWFLYDEVSPNEWQYVTYSILSLGGSP